MPACLPAARWRELVAAVEVERLSTPGAGVWAGRTGDGGAPGRPGGGGVPCARGGAPGPAAPGRTCPARAGLVGDRRSGCSCRSPGTESSITVVDCSPNLSFSAAADPRAGSRSGSRQRPKTATRLALLTGFSVSENSVNRTREGGRHRQSTTKAIPLHQLKSSISSQYLESFRVRRAAILGTMCRP